MLDGPPVARDMAEPSPSLRSGDLHRVVAAVHHACHALTQLDAEIES